MKRMNEVFELPVSYDDFADPYWPNNERQDEYIAHAINHVDALADALECLLNRLHYEGCDFADMAVAANALSAYRGGI